MIFYIGLHQPADASHFPRACISVNRLLTRAKPINVPILLDSGAFTEVGRHGHYRSTVEEYAAHIKRLAKIVTIHAAVGQDWMCEPSVRKKTGLTVGDHQRLTIERFDALVALKPSVPIMPVLQGWTPEDYVAHVRAYGDRLTTGMWVGVGSVCKRNGKPRIVAAILAAIKAARPDLRLHGFGLKVTALRNAAVRALLYSADSMGWSYAARRKRNGSQNDWREAKAFCAAIAQADQPAEVYQLELQL